jgi:hypothetical protein
MLRRVALRSLRRLLVTANVVPCSPILLILKALSSSVMSVLKTATRRNIPEAGILHIRDNFKCSAECLYHPLSRKDFGAILVSSAAKITILHKTEAGILLATWLKLIS